MAIGVYKIEDHACEMEARIEMAQTKQDGCSGIGHGPGVQYEDDGQIQEPGEIGGAAFALHRAVEQSHNTFGDGYFNIRRPVCIQIPNVFIAHHIEVKVDAVAAGGGAVMNGIEEIGTAFEGLYRMTFAAECAQEAQRDGGFAGAAVRGGEEELGDHQTLIYYVCTI